MSERTYATWVDPVASALADDRRELLEFATSASAAFWDQPSSVDAWTNRDILAHLAGGNDLLVQTLLGSLTAGETLDPKSLAPDTDAENARRVAERRVWPLPRLIAELERDHDEVLGWLSQLDEHDRDLRPEGLGMTVGEFFRIVQDEHHDLVHLHQLRPERQDK
ncbi:MAG: DinB family protein [Dehalococcoidia bacterium]